MESALSPSPELLTAPEEVLFANPRSILAEALRAYLPPDKVDVADYALNRHLNNRGGGYVGKWDHDEAPFLIEPMRSLTSSALTTCVVGPARCGKTTIGQNWMFQSVGVDPADFLVYAQTDQALESYVKREIEPMIELHPVMRDRLGLKPKDRSLHFKKFEGMWVEFLASTYNNLISKSAPRIIITELDACPVYDQGDTFGLGTIRRETFGRESMVLVESHPDRASGRDPSKWNDGIMKIYRDSDRRTWWWPCPHCNAYSSPTPGAEREMVLDWPQDAPLDEIGAAAKLVCPSCGGLIDDEWRRKMNIDGLWVASGQQIDIEGNVTGQAIQSDTNGFWITGLMSPFLIGGIGAMARDYAAAERHFKETNDDADLKSVTVKRFGLPYQPPNSARNIDAEILANRAETTLKMGIVPKGARFLTTAVDVQANRFELLTRAWGPNGESWVIDFEKIPADTAQSPSDWDRMIERLTDTIYPLDDSSGRGMKVLASGYDSGGAEGVTLQAYAAWLRARRLRKIKFAGTIDGRHAYTVMPLKGSSTPNAPMLMVKYPDSQRKDRGAGANGEIPLGLFNPNRFKDNVSLELAVGDPGPLYVHFPCSLRNEKPPHQWFEQLAAEERTDAGKWQKKSSGARNEALDLMAMSEVMATLFDMPRINWDAPPAWALDWDRNVMITQIKPMAAEAAITSVAPSPIPKAPSAGAGWMAEMAKKYGSN
ncbi:phage terminase large subunit family protein [Gluconobacter cerinus]|nr:phage terminase large subunit family protein [Gluconobacter cerinus]